MLFDDIIGQYIKEKRYIISVDDELIVDHDTTSFQSKSFQVPLKNKWYNISYVVSDRCFYIDEMSEENNNDDDDGGEDIGSTDTESNYETDSEDELFINDEVTESDYGSSGDEFNEEEFDANFKNIKKSE
ncbi:MAG: hypothetical protein N2B06_16955 [Clostridium sp.]